jgi:hypothetical protein
MTKVWKDKLFLNAKDANSLIETIADMHNEFKEISDDLTF